MNMGLLDLFRRKRSEERAERIEDIYAIEKASAEAYVDTMNRIAEEGLRAYDRRYKRDQELFREHHKRLMDMGYSDLEAMRECLAIGLGPGAYNPPAKYMVKYTVVGI